jgi:SOS-response transcriptional repressor LexA
MSRGPTHSGSKLLHFARTEAVYTFIRDYLQREGYPPSLRDIADGCGIGLTTANYHLHRLMELGLIRRASGQARSIRLVENEIVARLLTRLAQQPTSSILAALPLLAAATQETE